MELWEAGLFVGALGDIGLQLAEKFGFGNEGLKEYFRKENPLVSIFKASLLTSFWSGVYSFLFPSSSSLFGFVLFSGAVDVLYRFLHPWIYPTLDSYYQKNGPIETVVYNSLTAVMVWEFSKLG
jgi:hypothetical protein